MIIVCVTVIAASWAALVCELVLWVRFARTLERQIDQLEAELVDARNAWFPR